MNRIFVAALKEETPDLDFFHYLIINPFLLNIEAKYESKKIY